MSVAVRYIGQAFIYHYISRVFKGFVDGKESTLIQHMNQLNFLLTSVEKEPERPKRRIGFFVSEDQ